MSRIFRDRDKAVKLCKLNADNSRFKAFKFFKDAYEFSYDNESQSATIGETKRNKAADGERLPFSQPKTRDFNELRSFIEKSQVTKFKDKVASNPRYLISSGDAPVAVQEAFRYNCLHVGAKCNQHEIVAYVLKTLHDVALYRALYVGDTHEQSVIRSQRLLDLYLNTPEKGVSDIQTGPWNLGVTVSLLQLDETPLHFACKYGSFEVTQLLINERLCSKTVKNRNGRTAYELIGTKMATPGDPTTVERLKSLFDGTLPLVLVNPNTHWQPCLDRLFLHRAVPRQRSL